LMHHFYHLPRDEVLAMPPDEIFELLRCVPYASEWSEQFGDLGIG